MSLSDGMMPGIARVLDRAILGINIGDREADRDNGVAVLSVSPGGPAEEAGLKAGDVLLQIGSKQLKREGGTSPREKLLSTLRETKPGDKVTISYRRDGKVASATVTTEALKNRMVAMAAPVLPNLEHLPRYSSFSGALGSTELAPLTPKMGQYFGADKGLLVMKAPADSRLQLEDGDVLLDIDGRVPTSTSHALRILGSYQPGEKLKLNIMRMKKRMTLDITVPEDGWGRRGYRYDYVRPAPAAAPAPPAPAAPPAPPASPAPGAAFRKDGTV